MIYVECYADFALVESLGIAANEITHAFGKGRVCQRVSKAENTKGMVDEDPMAPQPSYLQQLKCDSEAEGVRVLRSGGQTLVVLCPRLEEWLFESAKVAGVAIDDFGFDSGNMHEMMGEQPKQVKQLVAVLRQKRSSRVARLEKLLKS